MQILRHSKIALTMEIYPEVRSAATRAALRSSEAGSAHERRCCTSLLHQHQERPVFELGNSF
jgi:hypothetical protein